MKELPCINEVNLPICLSRCENFASVADRECVFSDEDGQDYKQEALKQSMRRISSQMTKLSNIISHIVDCDDVSGKFSSCPIDIKELSRNSDDSVPKEADDETNGYENIPTCFENVPSDTGNVPRKVENVPNDPEKVVNDAKNAPVNVENGDRNPDMIPYDAETATSTEDTATGGDAALKSADSTTGNVVNTPPSSAGSVGILEDTAIPSETGNPSTRRVKSKAGKIRSFFKRKSRKDKKNERYMESPV